MYIFTLHLIIVGLVARLNDTSCLVLSLFVYVSASVPSFPSGCFVIGL
jgi:hypothetical protein